jgi:hypothetical protein
LVVVPDGVTWQEAEAAARKREGHLAVITSAAENRFVFEHLLSDPQAWDLPYGPWIGGFQPDGSSEPAGGWNWVTGEPFEYSNWFPERPLQEPNNGVNPSIVAQELRRRGLPESAREMLTRELQQQGPNTENCLQFIAKDGYGPRDGTWNDRPAESRHQAYIIEFTDPDAN